MWSLAVFRPEPYDIASSSGGILEGTIGGIERPRSFDIGP